MKVGRVIEQIMSNHIPVERLSYSKKVKCWLEERYGVEQARDIWRTAVENYGRYLATIPDYGGRRNGHATAIYGSLLIFALYPALPDQPPTAELQEFVQRLFMGPFTKLGKVFDLNRAADMWLIDKVFQRVGKRDLRDIGKWPDGFVNITEPYDRKHHASRYRFNQCPNAEIAKKLDLLHVLPLLCNCDYFGISEIHGQLIRCGTCGNGDACDYLVVGSRNPIASEYETVTDEGGFLVSRRTRGAERGDGPRSGKDVPRHEGRLVH